MSRLAGSATGRWAAAVLTAFALAAGAVGAGLVTMTSAVGLIGVGAAASGSARLAGARRVGAGAMLVVIAALLGALRGGLVDGTTRPSQVGGHLGARPVVVVGTVRGNTTRSDAVVDAERVTEEDADTPVSGAVLVTGQSLPPLLDGDRVEVDAAGLKSPGLSPGPESEAALEREGVQAIAASAQVTILSQGSLSPTRALAWLQSRLTSGVDQSIPEPAAALLLGIAFGIRQPLDADVRASLQDSGLIHIVVVSGLKVVILISLVAAVARRLEWSRRRTLAVSAPVVLAYVLLSGSGPAAIRSALMAGAAMLAGTSGRRTDPLPMLALAAAAMVGVQPEIVKDVGFQLSFLGTLGIVLLASPLAARIPGPRMLAEPFAVTIAAQLATVPVMAGSFGVIALGGPVANALVLPALPLLIVLGGGAAFLSVLAPMLAWLPLHVAAAGADVVVLAGRLVAAVPGSAIHIGQWPLAWSLAELAGLGIAALAWAAMQRHRGTMRPSGSAGRLAVIAAGGAAALTTAMVAAGPDGRMHVTVLDTGSAPAVLIRTSGGGTALVDGGSSPSLLVEALGRVLPPTTSRLDLVVITGGEQAAVAGLFGLAGHYSVGTVIAPVDLTPGAASVMTTLQEAGADLALAGRGWTWGGAAWACLDFRSAATGRDMCALTVADAGGRVLVLGDAGADDQEELAVVYGSRLRADLVVAEPGGALSPLLLDTVRPRLLAVPLVKGGLPAPGLSELPARRTGVDGDLGYDGSPAGLMEDG